MESRVQAIEFLTKPAVVYGTVCEWVVCVVTVPGMGIGIGVG